MDITLKKYSSIFHNISVQHLHMEVLHLTVNGATMLTGNFLSKIRTFWYNVGSNKGTYLNNGNNGHSVIRSWNYKFLINDNPAIQLGSGKSVLKRLCSNHPQQIITGYLNINSIRNKFGLMKSMLMHYIYGCFYGYRNKIRWFRSSFTI